MARRIEDLRNIGVIAHIDAGKTTVTERMLFYSGNKHRVGGVDEGTTTTDSDVEEQERGITIYAACVTFPWKKVNINLLDTPGHVDFTAEVERCLRVLDGAVVVFSAREGVEAQSETVWRQANKYKVPRIAFINKLDREGADFERVFEEIANRLGATPLAVQIPVGQGPPHVAKPFKGVIDLIRMKMLSFGAERDSREVVESDIPADYADDAEAYREIMLEKLYNYSNEMMELAMGEQPISEDLIRQTIRTATLGHHIQPVFCGSALHGIGVQPVLDAVEYYLPSPLDVPPVEGESTKKTGQKEIRKSAVDEPFCGLVFKVLPAKTGDIHWVRVYSGVLKQNSRVLNPGKDTKENVAQLWHIHATKKEEQLESVECGDIVGVIGLRQSITGDTICDTREPILLETIQFPETVISMAVEPESSTERKKLNETLELIKRQDPTLQVNHGDTGQTLLRGMGELHLEVIKNRLLRDFNLNIKFHKPQVSYRESIAKSIEVEGVCNRMINGQQLFARVKVRMEPNDVASPAVLVLCSIVPDSLPGEFLSATIDELKGCGDGGGRIAGYPLMKLKVTVLSGEWNAEQSDERAFKMAAADAFEKGLEAGGKVLLEPIMKLNIITPEDYLGDFVGDLQQRRATIVRTDNRGAMVSIEAHAPLRELFGYSSAMRSLSQGRAGASMEPLNYTAAPPEVVKEFEL